MSVIEKAKDKLLLAVDKNFTRIHKEAIREKITEDKVIDGFELKANYIAPGYLASTTAVRLTIEQDDFELAIRTDGYIYSQRPDMRDKSNIYMKPYKLTSNLTIFSYLFTLMGVFYEDLHCGTLWGSGKRGVSETVFMLYCRSIA